MEATFNKALPLPDTFAQLLSEFERASGVVAFLARRGLPSNLQAVNSLLSQQLPYWNVERFTTLYSVYPELFHVRRSLTAEEARGVQVRDLPYAVETHYLKGQLPVRHELPDLPDIELDGIGGSGTGVALARALSPSEPQRAPSASGDSTLAGDSDDRLTEVTMQPPGDGKAVSAQRRATFLQALLRRVGEQHSIYVDACAAAAHSSGSEGEGGAARKRGSRKRKKASKASWHPGKKSWTAGFDLATVPGIALVLLPGRGSTVSSSIGSSSSGTAAGFGAFAPAAAAANRVSAADASPGAPARLANALANAGRRLRPIGSYRGAGASGSSPAAASSSAAAEASAALLDSGEEEEEDVICCEEERAGSAASAEPPPAPPCSFDTIEAYLRSLPQYSDQLVHCEVLPPQQPVYADLRHAREIPAAVWEAFAARGIKRLFAHQAAAVDAALEGRHVVISTATSSGKSAAFYAPMLSMLLADRSAVAMYISPTKALAQDQLRALNEFLEGSPALRAAIRPATLDGDVPWAERGIIRDSANLILCNPDILHATVLPGHSSWRRVLSSLRCVVLDEAHVYRGTFGSHVSCVLRRLTRMAMSYGSAPRFIAASATIANPLQHFSTLFPLLPPGCPSSGDSSSSGAASMPPPGPCLISAPEDSSKVGSRKFILWNPPLRFPAKMQPLISGSGECGFLLDEEEQGAPWRSQGANSSHSAPATASSSTLYQYPGFSVGGGSHPGGMAASEPRENELPFPFGDVGGDADEDTAAPALAPSACFATSSEQWADDGPEAGSGSSTAASPVDPVGTLVVENHNLEWMAEHWQAQGGTVDVDADADADCGGRAASYSSSSAAGSSHLSLATKIQKLLRKREARQRVSTSRGSSGSSSIPFSSAAAAAVPAAAAASTAPSTALEASPAPRPRPPIPKWIARFLDGKREGEELTPRRRSSIVEAAVLLAALVQGGMRTIVFVRVRKLAELLLQYVHERLALVDEQALSATATSARSSSAGAAGSPLRCSGDAAPAQRSLVSMVKSYRAGYLKEHRRAIEKQLFQGTLRGVIATNALELGIDVGSLDAVMMLGWPGAASSFWQQAGRAGRGGRNAVVIMVAFDSAIDQHFCAHPEAWLAHQPEAAHAQFDNPILLRSHALCAAAEMPLSTSDVHFFGPTLGDVVAGLRTEGLLIASTAGTAALLKERVVGADGRDLGVLQSFVVPSWVGKPSSRVSLRRMDDSVYTVIDEGGAIIDEVEEHRAWFELHQGGIYMNQGISYSVVHLNVATRTARVRVVNVPYYTALRDHTDVNAVSRSGSCLGNSTHFGRVEVVFTAFGYSKISRKTGLPFESVDLTLPPLLLSTFGLWCDVSLSVKQRLDSEGLDFLGGCHAAGHALLAVLPLHVQCDRQDIGTECPSPLQSRPRPLRFIVFDRTPGGCGIAFTAFNSAEMILREALSLVECCPCEDGCLKCIHDGQCKGNNVVLDKRACVILLRATLGSL